MVGFAMIAEVYYTVSIEASPQFLDLGGVADEGIPSNNGSFANFGIADLWPGICPYELD
jgi:hypothetical protein